LLMPILRSATNPVDQQELKKCLCRSGF